MEEAIATKTKKIQTNAKVLKQLNFYGKLPRFSVRVIANQINRQLNRFVKHMVRLEQVVLCKISANCLPPTVFITVLLCHLRGKPRRTIRNQNYFSQKKRGHTSSSVWLRKTSPELQQLMISVTCLLNSTEIDSSAMFDRTVHEHW